TFGAPTLEGPIDASLRYQPLPTAAVRARASITTGEIRVSDLDARIGDSTLRGNASWSTTSDAIRGRLTASAPVKDLVTFSGVLPETAASGGSIELAIDLSGSS